MDGEDNGRFGTIKTNLENKITCGWDSYSNTKCKIVGLVNKYHVSKKLMQATPVKE